MRKGRGTVLIAVLLMAVLAGCAPRAQGGELTKSGDQSQIVVDLPALVIDVQSDGQTSIGGKSMTELGGLIGQDLSKLSFPPDTVQYLTAGNIQHIQIDNTSGGILILVNGEPIPSLAWDGNSLVATAQVLDTFGAGMAVLDKVLPLVRNLGVSVIIRLPVAEGTEPIPYVVTNSETAAAAMAAQEEFLKSVGTPPTFQWVITYASDGTWSAGDLTQADWSAVAPQVPWQSFNMTPDTLKRLTSAGVKEIGLATNKDGIFISINGKTLPYITWADGRVNHVIALAAQMGLLDSLTGANPDMKTVIETVQSLIPAVQASNVSVKVEFPS